MVGLAKAAQQVLSAHINHSEVDADEAKRIALVAGSPGRYDIRMNQDSLSTNLRQEMR